MVIFMENLNNVPALAFNGVTITDRGEMLSLTDMWKASGSDPAKAPAQWQRLPQAIEFVEHVSLIVGKSHNEVFQIVRGGNSSGTWAHWQIGLAYAKYLSPKFHMWCNTVVRERMEGKAEPMSEKSTFTAGGWLWAQPVARLNAVARMISVVSRNYGPEAARALWEQEMDLAKDVGTTDGAVSTLVTDAIGEFLAACVREKLNDRVQAITMYEAYVSWSLANHKRVHTNTKFGRTIARRFQKSESGGRIYYLDCELHDVPARPERERNSNLSVAAMEGRADDDAPGCWKHLMRAAVGNSRTIGSLLDLGMHDKIAAKSLRPYGLVLDPQEAEGFLAVANRHRFLASVFAATQWNDDWRLALLKLPGARPSKGGMGFGDVNSHAVLIPRDEFIKLRAPVH